MQPTIIGLDLAKSVFQVHGVDEHGKVALTKRLRRDGVLRGREFLGSQRCLLWVGALGMAPVVRSRLSAPSGTGSSLSRAATGGWLAQPPASRAAIQAA